MLIICDKIHLITSFFAFLNILPHGLWGKIMSPQFLPGNKKPLFSRLREVLGGTLGDTPGLHTNTPTFICLPLSNPRAKDSPSPMYLESECYSWTVARGEVSVSVGRAFLAIKLRQKVKATSTSPELLGDQTTPEK